MCGVFNEEAVVNMFRANISQKRKTWKAPVGYLFASHTLHRGPGIKEPSMEFAPRKGTTTEWPSPTGEPIKVKVVDTIKHTWRYPFKKGRYNIYTSMLLRIL